MAPEEPTPKPAVPSSETVGERIRQARREHPNGPMKLTRLAADLDVHPDTLTAYEHGTREVGAVTLWHIANLTKRPYSYFADQEPETANARLARVAADTQREIGHLTTRLEALMLELREARSDAAAVSGTAKVPVDSVGEPQLDVAAGASVVSRRKKRGE